MLKKEDWRIFMQTRKRRIYYMMMALLLTLCLLSGCITRPQAPAEPDPTAETTEKAEKYETYQEDSLKVQEEFDQLTEDIFRDNISKSLINLHYTVADPASLGITDYSTGFGDFTLEAMKEDLDDTKDILDQLDGYNKDLLRDDQKLTYDILKSSLSTEVRSEGMELYYQPVAPTIGVQAQLPILLAEYAFYSKKDIDEYLILLSQIDEYYAQIIEFEKAQSAAGLFMCDYILDEVLESCQGYLLSPEHSFLTETFAERLDTVEGVTDEEKDAYIEKNRQILESDFIPAYQMLTEELEKLRGTGTTEAGLWSLPKGSDYYKYMIASNTGTSYTTVDDLRKAIENQIDSDLMSMSKIIRDNPQVLDLLDNYSFNKTEPKEILEDLQKQLPKDFPDLPPCSYTVKYVPKALEGSLSPAFYLTPPLDNFENNVIYINGNDKYSSEDLYTVLAHEGYPGHLYQNVYFLNQNPCHLRSLMSFSSYSEGWATYVENYSYGLDNGLDPMLAEVLAYNNSSTLGLHALLDININYYKWTKEQVAEYLGQYYNIEGTDIVDNMYYAMIANPTNYLEYYVGYLEIIQMRDKAQKTLKDDFNLKEFNKFLLDIGPAPFNVITTYFKEWLLNYHLQ